MEVKNFSKEDETLEEEVTKGDAGLSKFSFNSLAMDKGSANDTLLCLDGGEGELVAFSPLSLLLFSIPALGEAAGANTCPIGIC